MCKNFFNNSNLYVCGNEYSDKRHLREIATLDISIVICVKSYHLLKYSMDGTK